MFGSGLHLIRIKLKTMKINGSEITIFTIILLLITSTFVGIPLNGGEKGWVFLNGIFRDVLSGYKIPKDFLSVSTLLATIALYLLPLFVISKYRKTLFIYIPLIYLVPPY